MDNTEIEEIRDLAEEVSEADLTDDRSIQEATETPNGLHQGSVTSFTTKVLAGMATSAGTDTKLVKRIRMTLESIENQTKSKKDGPESTNSDSGRGFRSLGSQLAKLCPWRPITSSSKCSTLARFTYTE